MPYALLDDHFHSNVKVIAMGLDGAGLYARALSYCADQLTDGFVPLDWVRATVGRRRKVVDKLTAVGAWEVVHTLDSIVYFDRTGGKNELSVVLDGFWIADYVQFNPSRREYEETHKKKASAGKKGAIKRWSDTSSDGTAQAAAIPEPVAPAMAGATPHAGAPARGPTPTPKYKPRAVELDMDPPDEPDLHLPSANGSEPASGEADEGKALDLNYLESIIPDFEGIEP